MTDTNQTWSVVVSTQGHPTTAPGTTYEVVETGLSRSDALSVANMLELLADEVDDECGCDYVGDDGEIAHRCTGYPIVTAHPCLDTDVERVVSAGRAT